MLFLCFLIVSLFLLQLVVVTGAALLPGWGRGPALGERGQGREADFNDGKLLVIVHMFISLCDVLCS